MPNRNYQAGVRFERQRKKHWEEAGYVVIRAAGSHGFADLVAFATAHDAVYTIQCKRVATVAQAKRLLKNFATGEPRYGYKQCMEVYVKQTREVMSVVI